MERSARRRAILDLLADEPLPVAVLCRRLAQRLGHAVGRRSVETDLRALQEQLGSELLAAVPASALDHLPAGCAGHRSFWRLRGDREVVVCDARLPLIDEDAVLALQLAHGLLAPPHADAEDPVHAALGRLLRGLGLGDAAASPIAALNSPTKEAYDPQILRQCMRAIRLGLALELVYEPLYGGERPALVQPLRLLLSEGEWFAFVWEHRKGCRSFKVARIRSLRTQREGLADVAPDAVAQMEGQLRSAFRNTMGNRRQRVRLRATAAAWPHLKGRRWGVAQEERELAVDAADDWRYEISFVTTGIEAVRHWLLAFGGDVVACEPVELRQWVAERGARLAQGHATPPP